MSSLELAGIPRSEISMKGAQLFSRGTRQSSYGRIRVGKLILQAGNERHEARASTLASGRACWRKRLQFARGLGNGLNEWWSHEPSGLEPGSPVTEVLLAAKTFERQLRELFYDNTQPSCATLRYGKSIRFEVSFIIRTSQHVGQYFEKFDEIGGTKRNRVCRRRLCLISSSMKFDIARTSTSPLNFMVLTSPKAILSLKSGD